PATVQEYCAEGTTPGNSAALASVVAVLQDLAIAKGALSIADAPAAPDLLSVRAQIAELGVTSLFALPLTDGEEQVGVLVLMHARARGWHSTDIVVLKALSEQVVIALNNAGLRRLVRNLSVTDEKSGLLKRASYLDLVLAETQRANQQATPLTILLMHFGKSSAMVKEFGEPVIEATMEQVGQLFTANIRSNDLAFRYDTTTVAIILGDTAE